jgi:hypothetical protein
MSLRRFAIWIAVLAFGSACGAVRVKRAASGPKLAAKPKDCEITFLWHTPNVQYHALADLQAHVTSPPPGGALEVLRPEACELGADAIIVKRNLSLNGFGHMLVAGTAIKLGELPPPPRPPNEEAPRASPAGAADL